MSVNMTEKQIISEQVEDVSKDVSETSLEKNGLGDGLDESHVSTSMRF